MKKRKTNTDGLYDCLRKQVCECNLPERYAECYDFLSQETRNWAIDKINECELVKLEYGGFMTISDAFCPRDRIETRGCYESVNEQLMERISEYIETCDKRRAFISGFTGSDGTAIVTEKHAALWTDGRYFLQAKQELDENWILMKMGITGTPTFDEFLADVSTKSSKKKLLS
ncbi:xaa-Pro aminopeptidase 1 [Trichonephila inaurata madagascariensis]|uniref:Xaa-Pro aminopeptidase 1 n=1 Tax=Trichonephila inaurata madagascariensis TaxID=2747483 RepID=A0A8X6YXY8_9ARAC|nr:xaa-Pro aminopeptidase 1 [Trichonephila inaurata madagascariensis]